MIKTLTKVEEYIMHALWRLNEGFVKDIIQQLPDPKPAYTTVSTMIRILVKKGFVGYRAYGNTYQYYPIVSKEEYSKTFFGKFINDYFSGSFSNIVSFFSKQNDLSVSQVDEIIRMLEKIKQEKKHE